MRKHISKELGLDINTHSQIEFIDVVLDLDTKLFIDPCLIDIHNNKWALNAKTTIDSYFNKFYEIYRTGQSIEKKLKLFEHTHEINATKLGFGNGGNGKAKTPEGMLDTFRGIDNLFAKGINLSHPIDLPLFIKNFSRDCLSDMLTNILFKVLNKFTLEQCEKYDVTPQTTPKKYHFWDCQLDAWVPYQGKCLVIGNEVILLVPKCFIRRNFYYNTTQYFSRIILEKIQQEKTWVSADGKEVKPTKKSLRKEIIQGDKKVLSAAVEYTETKPYLLNEYHDKIPWFYVDKGMSDEMLDRILYDPLYKGKI